ncbi:MAG: hypothetical protein RL885_28265, partial [Planctomycetota bacterium]
YDWEGSDLMGIGGGGGMFPGIEVEARADGEKPPQKMKTIILFEANENRHGGRYVLCQDGTIYHLFEDDFQELVSVR